MAFTIKKRRRARDRWKVQARAADAAARMTDANVDFTPDPERTKAMAEKLLTLDDLNTKEYTHTAKIPKDANPIGCVMVIICQDAQTGRKGAMISGHPSMDYYVMQDVLDAGDKLVKNLIRYTEPPKQDVSHIIIPETGTIPPAGGWR